MSKVKSTKKKIRDSWIPETWRYNGSGYARNKKKTLPRKQKYKQDGLG